MVMLVGNKIDMGYARQVATDDGLDWAEERGLFFLETSARDGTNVNRAFQILLQGTLLTSSPVGSSARKARCRVERAKISTTSVFFDWDGIVLILV